jgi:hypothetical protein
MKYEQPPRMSRAEMNQELASGDGDRIFTALLSAFYSEDCAWLESQCLRFIDSPASAARRAAALVLGNLAGVYGQKIDLMKACDVLQKLLADPDESVRTTASDSLTDTMDKLKLFGKVQ